MGNIMEAMIDYGVDMKTTLQRFGGDEALYVECLIKFLSDSSPALLRAAYKQKAYGETYQYAHTIKGVTGNLGLTPLYAAVSDLVQALRYETYEGLDEPYARAEAELSRLQTILGSKDNGA